MNARVPLASPAREGGAAIAHKPTILRAALLRFGFCYWTLFGLTMTDQIRGLGWFGGLCRRAWDPVTVWTGKHVLGISDEIFLGPSGSGDKTADWISLFCIVAISAAATLVWLVGDRARAHDAHLRALLRIEIRYLLGFILLGYGVSKVFLLQFPEPNGTRLIQRYGDSSPMGLLWTLMGASPAYQFFSGAAEIVGAVLLLFRRTTTLGAIVLGGVLINVVMLNLCYDVPVKINSSHYLAMCVLLLLPDLGRFASILWFNRPTQPVPHALVLPKRWMRITRRIVKTGIIVALVTANMQSHVERLTPEGSNAWYEGYWAVTRFTRDGQDVPAIVTDKTRWIRVRFQTADGQLFLRWRFMDESLGDLYKVALDEHAKTFQLTGSPLNGKVDHPVPDVSLKYTRIDADHLQLDSAVGTALLSVQLERWTPGQMLLTSRGFHWINEVAFNR